MLMTEEILDNYVNECKEKIEETIKEFKKMWCDHYNDIVVNLSQPSKALSSI